MLDLHPHFESHDVQCPSCGADAIGERDLRPDGCVHCLCPECVADDALALDHAPSCPCSVCVRYQRRTDAIRNAGLGVRA